MLEIEDSLVIDDSLDKELSNSVALLSLELTVETLPVETLEEELGVIGTKFMVHEESTIAVASVNRSLEKGDFIAGLL